MQLFMALFTAIENLFRLRISGRLIHARLNSTFVDSVVSAETATEVESTSVISSEVQSPTLRMCRKSSFGLPRALGAITDIWRPVIIR